MNDSERNIFRSFRQVIIWGFPLHSHTHSYIHGAWVKTFQHIGIPVHWFHDGSFPQPFDYTNTCFITEGWADDNIPIESSSTYFVHIAKDPSKYLDKGARLIEIRYHVIEINDSNYYYVRPTNAMYISKDTLYEVVPDDRAVASKRNRPISVKPYEVIYMHWATDLLPHEFNMNDASIDHQRVIHYIGTVGQYHPFHEYRFHAEQAGLHVIHHNPWSHPISYDDNIRLMKESYCCPDFRSYGEPDKAAQYGRMNGTNHMEIGYIPCRVLKAISYGHTGITNSIHVKHLLGDHVEYVANPADIIPIVEIRKPDIEWRQRAMKHVAENHTFLQRVRDLARVISLKKTQMTCVTAFYDIGREKIDGRSISQYRAWLEKTLQIIVDPIVLFLDPTLGWKEELLRIRTSIGPISIHEVPLQETKMWKDRHVIQSIMNCPEFKNKQQHHNDITNLLPEYCIIQYNKFDFLERTISANPFSSSSFCWMDAGISRFMKPSQQIQAKPVVTEHFSIQTNYNTIPSLDADSYIGSNQCILKGTLWVMNSLSFYKVYESVMDIWTNKMINQRRLDNEQIALALAYQENPTVFKLCTGMEQIQDILKAYFEIKDTIHQ
jgi:hypothetical protein